MNLFRFTRGELMLTAVLSLLVFLAVQVFVKPEPPMRFKGVDTITPKKVKRGGTVSIYREYTGLRAVPIRITREAVQGDCRKTCTRVLLDSSETVTFVGEYKGLRDHIVPGRLTPGIWRFEFLVHYENFIGRNFVLPMQVLEIEVIE